MPSATTTAKSSAKAAQRKRVPAEERREQVLEVAMGVVARDGMHAASTAEIAKGAGMSHAYLFRLFPTKEALMVAVAQRCVGLIRQGMADAAEAGKAKGWDPLASMGVEWLAILDQQNVLQVSLQSISAAQQIPAVGEVLRQSWEDIVGDIERVSGAEPDRVRAFIGEGMLLKIIFAMGATESAWVERLHHGPLPCGTNALAPGEVPTLRLLDGALAATVGPDAARATSDPKGPATA